MQTRHLTIALAARRILMLGALLAALLGPGMGAAWRSAAAPAAQSLTISLEPVADVSSLGGQPIAITNANDGSGRLFITLQEGKIAIYDGTQVLPTPFLDITSIVNSSDTEQGLLSVAFDPQYASNGYFYVDYINKTGIGDTVVARYQVSSDPNVANPAAHPLLTISQPQANHNGGQLQFGPDGYLYISSGDGGNFDDQGPGHNSSIGNAQDLSSLLGKMLRIDVRNNNTGDGLQYDIPPDNPFVNTPGARHEIWAYGLRNPWRFSFDRQTGDMFIGDVGQDSQEEIDYQLATSNGGENYGWRCHEGDHPYKSDSHCATETFTDPVRVYDHSPGSGLCAVTGGYRYRGGHSASLAGRYFYADYCNGQIWAATQNGAQWTETPLRDTALSISAFGEDQAGELYVADRNGGNIYRIVAPTNIAFLPLVRR